MFLDKCEKCKYYTVGGFILCDEHTHSRKSQKKFEKVIKKGVLSPFIPTDDFPTRDSFIKYQRAETQKENRRIKKYSHGFDPAILKNDYYTPAKALEIDLADLMYGDQWRIFKRRVISQLSKIEKRILYKTQFYKCTLDWDNIYHVTLFSEDNNDIFKRDSVLSLLKECLVNARSKKLYKEKLEGKYGINVMVDLTFKGVR